MKSAAAFVVAVVVAALLAGCERTPPPRHRRTGPAAAETEGARAEDVATPPDAAVAEPSGPQHRPDRAVEKPEAAPPEFQREKQPTALALAEASLAGVSRAGVAKGELRKWHRVTVEFEGPDASESRDPNPFTDYRLLVTFTHWSDGPRKRHVVPGFYAADGRAGETGAESGNRWQVRFAPDEEGVWTYRASFRTGRDVALSLDPEAGGPGRFDGGGGLFDIQDARRDVDGTLGRNVEPTGKGGRDFRGKGTLRYVGRHHLRFAETGEYYLKGGADSPENFLGYYGFDGTRDAGGGVKTPGLADGLHRYGPHAGDWRQGDPDWGGGRGRNIIGALNYLAGTGANSLYFITYNIDGGDGRDTWPWTTSEERRRFDCSKLDQWEIVFAHMDSLGIQLHFLTQETENDGRLGGNGKLNPVRKLYYREMVARFAHHPALIWNLGEENSNSDAERKVFARYIRDLDPYDHPITVHTHFGKADRFYDGLLGDPNFEATSIQGSGERYNHWASSLRARSAEAGRPWAVYGDEQGPCVQKDLRNLDVLRTGALWGNLMGGGAGVEWYFGYQGTFGDVQSEDWRKAAPLWEDTAHALRFFQTYLPFWRMEPANGLVSAKGALCLARPGELYAVYLPKGGTTRLDLGESAATFTVKWHDPRDGGDLLDGSVKEVAGPGKVSLGDAPRDPAKDWAILVQGPAGRKTPTIVSPLRFRVTEGRPFTYWIVADGAEPMTFSVEGLPEAWLSDGAAIRGELGEPGTVELTVTAANEYGRTSETLRIEVAGAPQPTEIVSPADGTELVEGSTVTLVGRGRGLLWSYDANSDKKGRIEIGRGPRVEFTVPTGVTGPRTLKLRLDGEGGSVTQNHRIFSPQP